MGNCFIYEFLPYLKLNPCLRFNFGYIGIILVNDFVDVAKARGPLLRYRKLEMIQRSFFIGDSNYKDSFAMLRETELVRRKDFGFYIIIEVSQLLLNNFPSISVIMVFKVLYVFKNNIFGPVLCNDSANIIKESASLFRVVEPLTFSCLTEGLARKTSANYIMMRNLFRVYLSNVAKNRCLWKVILV